MEAIQSLTLHLERCRPSIERAIARSEMTTDWGHVLGEIEQERAQLWPGVRSAVVSKIHRYPTGLRACSLWLAGGNEEALEELVGTERRIREWAKNAGCDRMEISGRRGWLRVLEGYREGPTTLLRDL